MHTKENILRHIVFFSARICQQMSTSPPVITGSSRTKSWTFRLARLAVCHNFGKGPIEKQRSLAGHILNNIYFLYLQYRWRQYPCRQYCQYWGGGAGGGGGER